MHLGPARQRSSLGIGTVTETHSSSSPTPPPPSSSSSPGVFKQWPCPLQSSNKCVACGSIAQHAVFMLHPVSP